MRWPVGLLGRLVSRPLVEAATEAVCSHSVVRWAVARHTFSSSCTRYRTLLEGNEPGTVARAAKRGWILVDATVLCTTSRNSQQAAFGFQKLEASNIYSTMYTSRSRQQHSFPLKSGAFTTYVVQ